MYTMRGRELSKNHNSLNNMLLTHRKPLHAKGSQINTIKPPQPRWGRQQVLDSSWSNIRPGPCRAQQPQGLDPCPPGTSL